MSEQEAPVCVTGENIPDEVAPAGANLYREKLPEGCPPEDATVLPEPTVVMRLIKRQAATDADFLPHSVRLDIRLPDDHDPCGACACSVFKFDEKNDAVDQYKKLPKLSRKYVAFLKIDHLSGHVIVTEYTGHISLWSFVNFDPLTAIFDVRERP